MTELQQVEIRRMHDERIAEARRLVSLDDAFLGTLRELAVEHPEEFAGALDWLAATVGSWVDEARAEGGGKDGRSSPEWKYRFSLLSAITYAACEIRKALEDRALTDQQLKERELREKIAQAERELARMHGPSVRSPNA